VEQVTNTARQTRAAPRLVSPDGSAALGADLGDIDAAAATTRASVPWPVLAAIGLAWALAIAAEVTGTGASLHHDALIEGGIPFGVALVLFLVAWQAMIAAMMLPSSLPLVRLLASASAKERNPRAKMAAFVGGYAVVWTVFAVLAFCGDAVVHAGVDASPWLADHSWLIAAGVLALAGAFQFSSLKDACLRECRHPGAFLAHHYLRGTHSGFGLGWKHGLFCLGCCWALMLVMFAAGVASLLWMAALTALMVYEKTGVAGRRAVPLAGVALLAWAGLVLIHPGWLPNVLGGGEI
jgi:predicted metal-binding membrane protein